MQTEDLNKHLLDLETRYWNSIRDKDFEGALKLTDEPCIVTGSHGVAQIDKKTFIKMMQSDTSTLHDFKFKDVKVQRLSDDVAVIGYNVHTDMTVDGKPVTRDAADASTWVKKNGQWVCALHSESLRNPSKKH